MAGIRTTSGNLSSNAGTVTFAARYNYVQVQNNDSVGMYVTTDGSSPSAGGADCDLVPANSTALIPNRAGWWYQGSVGYDGTTANPGTTVKMYSATATAAYSVTGTG